MRAFRFLNLALLAAVVAGSAALYAQDEKQQEDKPKQEEPKRQEEPKQQDEAKPASRQDEMKTPRQDEAKPSKQEQKQEEKQPREEMKPQEGHARPEGKGGHIPDDRFRAQFGRSHTFRAQRPVVVGGQPRFEYGGFSFALIDAWPGDWAYTDDCYIDYIDGEYFLFDMRHPGVRIALFVVM